MGEKKEVVFAHLVEIIYDANMREVTMCLIYTRLDEGRMPSDMHMYGFSGLQCEYIYWGNLF